MIRPAKFPSRTYRTWIMDSRRWADFRPRPDDIVIATYPKSGTTWMQRIVSLLVFQSAAQLLLWQISPWLVRRYPEPLEAVLARLEAQTHRRFIKTHLPPDGLPLFPQARYLHVARDGRDACLSYHHHLTGFSREALEALDREGLADPTIGQPYPEIPADPAAYFRTWLSQGIAPGHPDGSPALSWFATERQWWALREQPNLLFVHYADLKADLAGEMRRVARFLDIEVDEHRWPELVDAASFAAMRRDGPAFLGEAARMWAAGSDHFFAQGRGRRWPGVLTPDDLARYAAKVAGELPADAAHWLAHGRLGADGAGPLFPA